MKLLCCVGKITILMILSLALTGGGVYSDKAEARGKASALGGGGDSGSQPGPGDITNCADCQTLVTTDLNGDGRTSVTDLLGVLQALQPGGSCPFTVGAVPCDVNGDGTVDWEDFDIERKCQGCMPTPSPWQ